MTTSPRTRAFLDRLLELEARTSYPPGGVRTAELRAELELCSMPMNDRMAAVELIDGLVFKWGPS